MEKAIWFNVNEIAHMVNSRGKFKNLQFFQVGQLAKEFRNGPAQAGIVQISGNLKAKRGKMKDASE